MWSFLNQVKDYAFEKHKSVNQNYGDFPYSVHLIETANNILKYLQPYASSEEKITLISASYCHDLIEDTRTTYNDLIYDLAMIKKHTNISDDYEVNVETIADIVFDLTNEKGKNRAERENDKYFEPIANNNLSKIVKLSDRLANIEHSMLFYNLDKMTCYYNEHKNFVEKLKFDTILKDENNKLKDGVFKMLEVLQYDILTVKTILENNITSFRQKYKQY